MAKVSRSWTNRATKLPAWLRSQAPITARCGVMWPASSWGGVDATLFHHVEIRVPTSGISLAQAGG